MNSPTPQRPRQQLPAGVGAIVAVLALVFGIWLGGHAQHLPGFVRDTLAPNSDTQIVNEAIADMQHDYYRPLSAKQLSNASIAGAVASLGDRFSNYLTPAQYKGFDRSSSYTGIGIEVSFVPGGLQINTIFDGSPAARAGLHTNDVITAVDGKLLGSVSQSQGTSLITGRPGTDVHLDVQRAGKEMHFTVTREVVNVPLVSSSLHTYKGVKLGVVALSMFEFGAHGQVRQAVDEQLHRGARGLVLDLRNNGGGLVNEARLIASIFIPKGVIVTTRGRTQPTNVIMAAGDAIPTSIPVVVLVDGGTASSSEIVTAALQDHHRAKVVGTHTFGKGVFQEVKPLSNGGALDITVGQYFTPSGRNLGGSGVAEGPGITPNVPVAQSQVDGNQGLNKALATLAAEVR